MMNMMQMPSNQNMLSALNGAGNFGAGQNPSMGNSDPNYSMLFNSKAPTPPQASPMAGAGMFANQPPMPGMMPQGMPTPQGMPQPQGMPNMGMGQ